MVDEVFGCLDRHPGGIAQKYRNRKYSGSQARLRKEVERAYDRPPKTLRVLSPAPLAMPVMPGPAPAAKASAPTPLASALAIYHRWLALKNDWPVYGAFGAIAANLLDGDPVWLGLIGPPSSSKTELLNR